MRCIDCGGKLERTEGEYKMVALDKPYANLFFHPKCLSDIEQGNEKNLSVYLTENYEIWYNKYIEYGKSKRKRGKRKKN